MTAEIIPFPTKEVSVLETCVLCDNLTDVRKDTPVKFRRFYVGGMGQLHPDCYDGIYITKGIQKNMMPEIYEN